MRDALRTMPKFVWVLVGICAVLGGVALAVQVIVGPQAKPTDSTSAGDSYAAIASRMEAAWGSLTLDERTMICTSWPMMTDTEKAAMADRVVSTSDFDQAAAQRVVTRYIEDACA